VSACVHVNTSRYTRTALPAGSLVSASATDTPEMGYELALGGGAEKKERIILRKRTIG
jgi:hypothetical protein